MKIKNYQLLFYKYIEYYTNIFILFIYLFIIKLMNISNIIIY